MPRSTKNSSRSTMSNESPPEDNSTKESITPEVPEGIDNNGNSNITESIAQGTTENDPSAEQADTSAAFATKDDTIVSTNQNETTDSNKVADKPKEKRSIPPAKARVRDDDDEESFVLVDHEEDEELDEDLDDDEFLDEDVDEDYDDDDQDEKPKAKKGKGSNKSKGRVDIGDVPSTCYTSLKSIIEFNKDLNPLGIVVNTSTTATMLMVFSNDRGDMYRCNEPKNMYAMKVFARTTDYHKRRVQNDSSVRSPKDSLITVVDTELSQLALKYPLFDKSQASKRAHLTFRRIMAAFNTSAHNSIGNMELRRIMFMYAKIRLGHKGHREETDNFGALAIAIKRRLVEDSHAKGEGAHIAIVFIHALLIDHAKMFNGFELPPVPVEAVLLEDDKTSKRVKSAKDRFGSHFLIEARDNIKDKLKTIVSTYGDLERDEIVPSRWIGQPHGKNAKDKKVAPTGSTTESKKRKRRTSVETFTKGVSG